MQIFRYINNDVHSIIEQNGIPAAFDKPYFDLVFITLFVIINNNNSKQISNVNAYDSSEFKEDYLYFANNLLLSVNLVLNPLLK